MQGHALDETIGLDANPCGKEGCNAGSGTGVCYKRNSAMEGVQTIVLLVVAIDSEVAVSKVDSFVQFVHHLQDDNPEVK